ncbi:MAG: D-alanine--D-alanine ligase A [Chlamydiae bacterium]|nr:D-alanine--D-alanine ligase A [Chlamydiota bacterium]
MKKRINIVLLFGGKSIEHEVSLQSARSILEALDKEVYNPILIGIDKEGSWHRYESSDYVINENDPKRIALSGNKRSIPSLYKLREKQNIDVVFPILHGLLGEDGTVQGLLRLLGLPFVGADVLGSAIGMDKDVMKRLLRDADIPVADFRVFHMHQRHLMSYKQITEEIAPPFFVKPANAGSSIGISKVKDESEFEEAIHLAFQYDRKILIEKAIEGREFNCSILGNEHPIISLPCEIIPRGEFHSYASKYIDPEGAEFLIPAKLTPEELSNVQMRALETYRVLCCEGFARVDLFLSKDGEVYVNELNTIPGLTRMSPYAKMWEASGLPYNQLIDRLIRLAMDRHEKQEGLCTHFDLQQIEEELWAKT